MFPLTVQISGINIDCGGCGQWTFHFSWYFVLFNLVKHLSNGCKTGVRPPGITATSTGWVLLSLHRSSELGMRLTLTATVRYEGSTANTGESTHTHPCILVRTIFPDPSCEDTLFHSSYPNDTGAFISWLLGLLKHLVEIRKRPIFFVGTLYIANFAYLRGLWSGQYLWAHRATHPTCGDCILRQYLWVHMAKHLTCEN